MRMRDVSLGPQAKNSRRSKKATYCKPQTESQTVMVHTCICIFITSKERLNGGCVTPRGSRLTFNVN